MRSCFWVMIALSMIFLTFQKQSCQLNTCTEAPQDVIHVQMGAHSHLDAFWLQTYEEYLNGSGHDGVHYWVNVKALYTGMFAALKKDPKRTYQMAEVCFIKPWYESLSDVDQLSFKEMLKSGQIEILNGGWVQNDEACPYYDDIIDQLTLGHLYLNKTLGITPQVAFNVDNFGHSMTQAAIFSQMGFNAQIIARLDTEDIKEKTRKGSLEFVWEPTPSTGVFKDSILTQIRYKRHGPWAWHNEPVNNMACVQLEQIFLPFEDYMHEASKAYSSKDIYYYAGDDFQFFSDSRFDSLETLIDYYKDRPCKGIQVDYSAPTQYFSKLVESRKQQQQFKWTKKHTDFFPYWEDGLYWTGYFTSSPSYKIYFRDASRYLQSFRKMLTSGILNQVVTDSNFSMINEASSQLQEQISLAQHHDGISSTSKYGVLDNVVGRISQAWNHLQTLEMDIVQNFHQNQLKASTKFLHDKPKILQCSLKIDQTSQNQCELMLMDQNEILLSIFNPQSKFKYNLKFQLPLDTTFIILDSYGKEINSETICDKIKCISNSHIDLEPYQMQYFKLIKIVPSLKEFQYIKDQAFKHQEVKFINGSYTIVEDREKDGLPQLTFIISDDQQTFQINQKYNNSAESEDYKFKISLESYTGTTTQQWSNWDQHYFYAQCGKYVMMNDNQRVKLKRVSSITISNTNNTIEVKIHWETLAITTLSINKQSSKSQVDLVTEWDGGALGDSFGDFVLVFKENSIKKQKFFVDANGLTMIQRRNNWREDYVPVYNSTDKVPGNYYPMTALCYIEDEKTRMTIFTDRAQGVASLNDGEIEINIDRLAGEDGRGVGEWLKGKTQLTLKHHLSFQSKKKLTESIFIPFHQWDDKPLIYLTAFAEELTIQDKEIKSALLNEYFRVTSLPLEINKFLIRIQNVDETKNHKINLFDTKNLEVFRSLGSSHKYYELDIEETTLNGIKNLEKAYKERWLKQDQELKFIDVKTDILDISPRQIRTFIVKLSNISEYKNIEIAEQIKEQNEKENPKIKEEQDSNQIDKQDEQITKSLPQKIVKSMNDNDIIDQENRILDKELIRQKVSSGPRPKLNCETSQILLLNLVLLLIQLILQ